MRLPVLFTPKAGMDVLHAARWYGAQRTGLDREFLAELEAHFDTIANFPNGAVLISRTLRMLPMRKFPFVITYRATTHRIIIVRVVHGRRHPIQRRG